MKPKFRKAVDNRDLEGVRISLASEMMLDPRGESFNEMRNYAENTLTNLYDKHDGAPLDMNKDNWTEELLQSIRNDLDDNFSNERLDYYVEVAKVVLKDKAKRLNYTESKAFSNSHSSANRNRQRLEINPLSMCLTIGGLIIGGTGLIIGRTIVSAIGVIGMVVGGCQIYNDNKR